MGVVADTSSIIGAWHMHYLPDSLKGFWSFFDDAWTDGRIVVPEAVYDELSEQSEQVFAWVKDRRHRVELPSEEVQETDRRSPHG